MRKHAWRTTCSLIVSYPVRSGDLSRPDNEICGQAGSVSEHGPMGHAFEGAEFRFQQNVL